MDGNIQYQRREISKIRFFKKYRSSDGMQIAVSLKKNLCPMSLTQNEVLHDIYVG